MQDPLLSTGALLDNDAIEAMKVVADNVPSIREFMEGLVSDIVSAEFDASKALTNAKALTERLNDNIESDCGGEGAS